MNTPLQLRPLHRTLLGAALCLFVTTTSHAQVIFINPQGTSSDNQFGALVGGIKDCNGDGFDDVVAGAPYQRTGIPLVQTGAAYIFSGRDGSVLRTILSPLHWPGGGFGGVGPTLDSRPSSSGLGDPLIGAYGEARTYRFDGFSGELVYTLIPQSGPEPASSLAVGRDTQSELGDFLVMGNQSENRENGRLHIFRVTTGQWEFAIDPPPTPNPAHIGHAVACVADMNGDGIDDILAGTPNYHYSYDQPGYTGRAYLFSGADGSLIRLIESPLQPPWEFGHSVAGIPDLDDDGYGDYAISSPNQNAQGNARLGAVYVYSGHSGTLLYTLRTPRPPSSQYGARLRGVEDLNGDGRGDLLISAPDTYPGGQPSAGVVDLMSGRTGTIIRYFVSPTPRNGPYGAFGVGLSTVRDATPNSPVHIVIGSLGDCSGTACPPTQAGRIYIFPSCAGDYNYDGRLNSQDFYDFLTAYFTQLPGGDFNRDAQFNSQDLFDFLASFFAGCPTY